MIAGSAPRAVLAEMILRLLGIEPGLPWQTSALTTMPPQMWLIREAEVNIVTYHACNERQLGMGWGGVVCVWKKTDYPIL